jgi:hypothetical protein
MYIWVFLVQNLKMKIYPKSFRPKRSFVRSIPALDKITIVMFFPTGPQHCVDRRQRSRCPPLLVVGRRLPQEAQGHGRHLPESWLGRKTKVAPVRGECQRPIFNFAPWGSKVSPRSEVIH